MPVNQCEPTSLGLTLLHSEKLLTADSYNPCINHKCAAKMQGIVKIHQVNQVKMPVNQCEPTHPDPNHCIEQGTQVCSSKELHKMVNA